MPSNPEDDALRQLVAMLGNSSPRDGALKITKGSALEIPRTTDDACDEVLGFQGQSPWLWA